MENKNATTIQQAIENHLAELLTARSAQTVRAYRNGLKCFVAFLLAESLSPDQDAPAVLYEKHVRGFLIFMQQRGLAASSRRLYLAALKSFLEYLTWERLAHIDMRQTERFIKKLAPDPGHRLPQFPKDDIEKVIVYAADLHRRPHAEERQGLVNLRDRAFILTLADTGLRVHEACSLRRGDIDWHEARATVIGKGNKQALVRFTARAIGAMRDYFTARKAVDAKSGKQMTALPIFLSHNNAGEKNALPISTKTGRQIVKHVVAECLGPDYEGAITPHSFRHYFVTTILLVTGDIHRAQKLARHSNIATTEQYGHLADQELDATYQLVFENE